ncbi:MAG TPA: gamma-glutamyl-phosphate reductase, partial [Desulfobulbaceae bacterium]|nr:gamma-glutamyl-phosphate reductase [Desulfobulbaceae bacterium]
MHRQSIKQMVVDMATRAKKASRSLAVLPTALKNQVLLQAAEMLMEEYAFIEKENNRDLAAGREKGLSAAMLDRLELSEKVLRSMVTGLREVAALP